MRRAGFLFQLCLTACSRGYGRGELSPTEADGLRDALQAYVIAQETHYASHNAYSGSLATLGVTTTADIEIVSADAQGHAAVVTLEGDNDAGCAVFVGGATPPSTPGGRAAASEGIVVCDRD